MSGGWSATIDPAQLAEQGAELSGELPLTSMPRLAASCLDQRGSVSVDLKFGRDGVERLRYMRGRVRAQVRLTCQRCLEPMTLTIETAPDLLVLRPGERDDLEQQDDVVVVPRAMPLSDFIEDDLLLALPMIPMHPLAECPAKDRIASRPKAPVKQRANPFAGLKTLKRPGPKE